MVYKIEIPFILIFLFVSFRLASLIKFWFIFLKCDLFRSGMMVLPKVMIAGSLNPFEIILNLMFSALFQKLLYSNSLRWFPLGNHPSRTTQYQFLIPWKKKNKVLYICRKLIVIQSLLNSGPPFTPKYLLISHWYFLYNFSRIFIRHRENC